MKPDSENGTPEAWLRVCMDNFDPKEQRLIRSVWAALRRRFPTANELAYDYSHPLVISISPTERGIDAVVALSARDAGVSLLFNQELRLPDPTPLLQE